MASWSNRYGGSTGQDLGTVGSYRPAAHGHSLRSQKSTSSTDSTARAKVTEAAQIIELLRQRIVYLTGGRDKRGGPLLTFPSHPDVATYPHQDLISCLSYLTSIPTDESRFHGFTVLIDNRQAYWKSLKTLLKLLTVTLPGQIYQVLVLKPEQKLNVSFRRDKNNYGFEVHLLLLPKLVNFIPRHQLIAEFGGTLPYSHEQWLQARMSLEKFLREARATLSHLESVDTQITGSMLSASQDKMTPIERITRHRSLQQSALQHPNAVIQQGEALLSKLQGDINSSYSGRHESHVTLDTIHMQNRIKKTMSALTGRLDKINDYCEDQEQQLAKHVQYDDLMNGIKTVVDWILGPAEKLLRSQIEIGDSYKAADQLRKKHEELELKCTETYGTYAELRHDAETLLDEVDQSRPQDIVAQRDYLDTVCRSYATRLERRRNLIIAACRFYRHAETFSGKLDELLHLLCSDIIADTAEAAQTALTTLEERCIGLIHLAEQTVQEGQTLLDLLSQQWKNAFGEDITPDYSREKGRVQQMLEDLQERKLRCDELSDVRRLKIQQILQLRICERDADQAIAWILELCEVMVRTHTEMGRSPDEAEHLQKEHQQFQQTARGTYEYGKQLLQAALVLRRSLRFDVAPNTERAHRLADAWKRFTHGINERASRLSVAAVFHRNADKLMDQIEIVLIAVSQVVNREITPEELKEKYGRRKRKLGRDYQQTWRTGTALLERMSIPVIVDGYGEKRMVVEDDGSAEVIRSKLDALTYKMEELSTYWGEDEGDENDDNENDMDTTDGNDTFHLSDDVIAMETAPRFDTMPNSQSAPLSNGNANANERRRPNEATEPNGEARYGDVGRRDWPALPPGGLRRNKRFVFLYEQLRKSNEWIRVKIQTMEPDLMEVGTSLGEAVQLRRELDELCERLREKQGQVTELLTQADDLVAQEQDTPNKDPQVSKQVYQAMADSLAEAWKDLNAQLDYRRMLLDQSIAFHQSASDFEDRMEKAFGRFGSGPLATDVETARYLLQQHKDIKKKKVPTATLR